jgi:hypothetical protein
MRWIELGSGKFYLIKMSPNLALKALSGGQLLGLDFTDRDSWLPILDVRFEIEEMGSISNLKSQID